MAAALDFSRHLSRRAEPLDILHAQFSVPLKRFFRSYRLNTSDVEDLTQEVFMRLMRPSGQADLREPAAYVFTLARNLVRDRARRLHTRALAQSIALEEVQLSCGRPTPDQSLELAQRLAHVNRALASLKPKAREAFVLHRVHGESYSAIAIHMDISVSMVEKHIMAAIIALGALEGR